MAKLALINRNEKRKKLVEKFAKKRDALQAIIDDPKASDETATRRASRCRRCRATPTRRALRNRCALTGRPRGVFSKFGLGRNKLREYAMRGEVPASSRPAGKRRRNR